MNISCPISVFEKKTKVRQSMEETKVSLKLLIDKENQRVLYAEAGKDSSTSFFTFWSFWLDLTFRFPKSRKWLAASITFPRALKI